MPRQIPNKNKLEESREEMSRNKKPYQVRPGNKGMSTVQ